MAARSLLTQGQVARHWRIVIVLGVLLTLPISRSGSQEGVPSRGAKPADIDHTQFLRTVDDVNRLRRLRNRLIASAIATLDEHADNPKGDWSEARKAVQVLRILRPSDPNSLQALCRSIKLNTYESELTPLEGYVAAQALVEIGGRPVAQAIFTSMRRTVDHEGLLLRAFVLRKMDSPEIALERVRLEFKSAEAKSPEEDVLRNAYLKNLQQLEALLNDPNLGDHINWPGNHQAPFPAEPNRVTN